MRLKIKDNDKIMAGGWMLDLPFNVFVESALVASCRVGDRDE